jgi:hypothetical protein
LAGPWPANPAAVAGTWLEAGYFFLAPAGGLSFGAS